MTNDVPQEEKTKSQEDLPDANQNATEPNQTSGFKRFKRYLLGLILIVFLVIIFIARPFIMPFLASTQKNVPVETSDSQKTQADLAITQEQSDELSKETKQSPSPLATLPHAPTFQTSDLEPQLDALSKRIEQLETRFRAYENHSKKVAQLYSLFEDLKKAVHEGSSFTSILDNFAGTVENYSEFNHLVLELSEYAEVGVPSVSELHHEIEVLIQSHKKITASTTFIDSCWQRVKYFFSSMVHVYKLDHEKSAQALNVMDALYLAQKNIHDHQLQKAYEAVHSFENILEKQDEKFILNLKACAAAERILKQMDILLASPRFIQLLISSN